MPVLQLRSLVDAPFSPAWLLPRLNNDDMALDNADEERLVIGRGVTGLERICSGWVVTLVTGVEESSVARTFVVVGEIGSSWFLPA